MDKIKIENFYAGNSGDDFPEYVSLSKNACSEITQSLRKKLVLENVTDGLALVRAIDALEHICDEVPRVNEAFRLCALLNACEISASNIVYINWYRFDNIDKLKLADLDEHFFDIWYPDVDDIDIFDDSLDWILSVRHDGCVKILRAQNE